MRGRNLKCVVGRLVLVVSGGPDAGLDLDLDVHRVSEHRRERGERVILERYFSELSNQLIIQLINMSQSINQLINNNKSIYQSIAKGN